MRQARRRVNDNDEGRRLYLSASPAGPGFDVTSYHSGAIETGSGC